MRHGLGRGARAGIGLFAAFVVVNVALSGSFLLGAAVGVAGLLVVAVFIALLRRMAGTTAATERRVHILSTALSNTADFVYLFDLQGRFTYANKALLDLWQKSETEARGRNFHELGYPPELADRLLWQIQEVISTGRPVRDETPYSGASGGGFYEYIFVPVFGANGQVETVAGSTREITERKRAEDLHQFSEERYRVLVTANADVVYRMSADWSEMYPLDGRDLVGSNTEPIRGWLEANIPPFEDARVREAIARVVEGRQTFELEHQVVRADGSLGWTLSRAAPILDPAGGIVEWFGTARDITEGKRTEEALRRSESLMRLATDAAELGVWVWNVADDRVAWENERPYEMFGLDRDSGPVNAARFLAEYVHPDDAAAFGDAVSEALQNGERFHFLGRMRRGDGEIRWVEFTGLPLRSADGSPKTMHGTATDVTERMRAEEALRESEAEFRAMFERAGVGKAQADPDTGRFLRVNAKLCELMGYEAGELLGMTIRELTHPDDREAGDERFRSMIAGTVAEYAVEKRYLHKSGEAVWVRVTANVVRTPEGRAVRASAIIEDVTARIQAVAALKDADRRKDDFIALLGHELRNPLAPIRNGLQVVRLSDDRATRERSQAMMDRQLAHMVRMIDDLLDVSRIGRNKMELRRARVTLAEVVDNAVETARPALDEAGHTLTVTLPTEPVYLDADLTRLSQVFSNILTNSGKYTPRGGTVALAAEVAGGTVSVAIRDNGIGIPPEALRTIFDMFSQVDRPIERSTGGLGIGLALVKGLVEMHGGTVTALSKGEGRGSSFTVELPRAAAPESETLRRKPMEASAGPKRRILVVDDNRDGAESLAMMLGLFGNEVAMAHDGLEAVESAERFRPEIILMDVGMPRLNGLEATVRIREQAWGREMVIVALTGWGQDGDRERSREAGCDRHLVKPVNPADLAELLSDVRR